MKLIMYIEEILSRLQKSLENDMNQLQIDDCSIQIDGKIIKIDNIDFKFVAQVSPKNKY